MKGLPASGESIHLRQWVNDITQIPPLTDEQIIDATSMVVGKGFDSQTTTELLECLGLVEGIK